MKEGRKVGPADGATSDFDPVPAPRFLLLTLSFAVWTGLLEEIPVFIAPLGGVVVRLSRDFVWMAPLGNLLFFSTLGLVLLLLGHRWPAFRSRPWALSVYTGLSAFALLLVPERVLHPLAALLLAIGVASVVRRRAAAVPRVKWLLPLAAASGVFLVLGLTFRSEWRERVQRDYWISSLPAAPEGAPNIILVILDTVRGASLRFLDGYGPMSEWPALSLPTLDRLAEESVVFERATAPSPWTLPSHASMFTGRWPNRLSAGGVLSLNWMGALGPEYPTVAEVLRRRGYFTAGFVGNLVFTSAETGLSRGFILYEDYTVSPGQVVLSCALGRRLAQSGTWRSLLGFHDTLNRKDAKTVADQFLAWRRSADGRPYFAFLNFFDAHEPYFPPDSVRKSMPRGERWSDFSHLVGLLTGATAWRTDKWAMTPAERRAHAAGYEEGIREADRQLGRILRTLEERGGMENTVLIVASDHGEQLGEHGLFNHNNSLYMPLLHVPLLIRDPREEPARLRVDRVVSVRDMAATILDLAGEGSMGGIQGGSLGRYWRDSGEGQGPLPERGVDTVFASLNRGAVEQPWYPVGWGPTMYSLVDSLHHYIFNGDGTEELYDLEADPGEMRNLAGMPGSAPVLQAFRASLQSLAPALPPFADGPTEHPRPPGS